ncbi:MAG TPA: ABC transporter ATP-binding protein, partial [Planctomycetota bacterium]|nr:ABC transporter ATP-binding protein [Planctomycetota bacterium]
MISLTGVSKSFGRKVAVANLTLEIPPGQIFALLGPNGAGKTTTIKMIAGLLRPDAGQVRVCGFDVDKDHLRAKEVTAYVPDEPFLYDKLTGREFLDFIGRLYKFNGSALRGEIDRWSSTFDMGGFIDDLTESYSHGMKQRLAISAALI